MTGVQTCASDLLNRKMAGEQFANQVKEVDVAEYTSLLESTDCIKRWDALRGYGQADRTGCQANRTGCQANRTGCQADRTGCQANRTGSRTGQQDTFEGPDVFPCPVPS